MNSVNQTGNAAFGNAALMYGLEQDEKKKKKEDQQARVPGPLQQSGVQQEPGSPSATPVSENSRAIPPVPAGAADGAPVDYAAASADVARMKSRLGGTAYQRPKSQAGSRFYDTVKDIMVPENTPERRMRIYAASDAALEDAVGGSFGDDMKERFNTRRQESRKKSEEAYRNSMSVVGANPEYGMFGAMEEDDAIKDADLTVAESDFTELARRVAPLARHGGFSMEEYMTQQAIPRMYETLFDEALEEEKPKSSAEYILRSSLNNSVVGKVGQLYRDLGTGNHNHTTLHNEGLSRYGASRMENFASGVGSLLVDAPVFSSLGRAAGKAAGGIVKGLTNNLTSKILSAKMGEGMTRATAAKVAERIISNRIGVKILQSSTAQGLTLGGYDAINSALDDMLQKDRIDFGKGAAAYGKGLLTGATLGVVGTPLREASKGLTGAKKMLASTGVLSAESAVFTASSEIEKLRHGIDIEPLDILNDFGESAATLLVMRMTHWRPKGAGMKLGADGKLKSEFALSNSEKAELRELNVNPEQFTRAIESELRLPSFGGERARYIKEAYVSLVTNDKLSAAAKAKLLFLVENKVTSTPPVPFDFSASKREDGKWEIGMYDEAGRAVSRRVFDHAGNAKSYMMVNAALLRRNRIAAFETELTAGMRSVSFLRQAGIYARKSGRPIEEISDVIYRKCMGKEMSREEQKMIDDILERSSYDEAGMVQMLYNVRRKIEKKLGLEKGTMFIDIHESFFMLSEAKNRALDEYEAVLRDEVDRLEGGTERLRSVRLLKQGLGSEYFGMTNSEVIEREIQDHYDWVAIRDADRIGLKQQSTPPAPPRLIYIPPTDEGGYVWSYSAKNTKADIARYAKRAQEIADRFGVRLNLIFDEREIERPSPEDTDAVLDYNHRVVADGWVHKGNVFINLPNAKNVEAVERTVLHETVAHKGLLGVFGEYLYEFLEDVYRKASPEVLRGINKIKGRYKFADNYTVIEEYLAYLAESVNTSLAERKVYHKVMDYIRHLLVKMNIYTGSNRQVSEAELLRIMKRHAEYMQKGTPPSEYMRDVFARFKSAHHPAEAYHNRAGYEQRIRDKVSRGKLLSSVPRPLRGYKELMYYDFLTPEQQKAFRERFGYTEEDMQRYTQKDNYMLDEEPAEEYRPAEGPDEWSGAVPGGTSSAGLFGEGPAEGSGEWGNGAHAVYPSWKNANEAGITPDVARRASEYFGDAARNRLSAGMMRGATSRYQMPEDLYRVYGDKERLQAENEALKRNPDAVPVLRDPFYRSLKANSPVYSFAYEHLRELPLEKWDTHDYGLWDTLVGMAEKGAVRFVLKDIVTDKKFLDDYPELAMVPVKISKDLQAPVMYDKENNRILLDSRVYLYPQSRYYIDAALQGVARNFEERRASAARQVDEFNTRFKDSYENGVAFARKITAMREHIPGFDSGGDIAMLFKNEYGFMPDEFLRRFPEMDDYLLYRVTRSMNGMLGKDMPPQARESSEAAISKKIGKHRKFFWGPVEIIMDAAGGGKGPLRVAGEGDRENNGLPESGLDMSENAAMFLKYSPEIMRYYGIPDPAKKVDPTGWPEYRRILEERKRKRKEQEEREKELEREKRWLELN